MQGLVVVGLIFEEISNKVIGVQNIGHGQWVKVPAESLHGEALCKVRWLKAL